VEVTPGAPHRLITAAIDKIGAEHLVAVADECIVAVPFVHAEIGVETVCDGVPRHLPTHSCLQALDVVLWCARGECERGGASVEMGEVGNLIGTQGAATAGVLGPAEYAGLKEGAIDDQLPATLEQVEQANLAPRSLEFVHLLDGHPRHSPAFSGQGVAGPR